MISQFWSYFFKLLCFFSVWGESIQKLIIEKRIYLWKAGMIKTKNSIKWERIKDEIKNRDIFIEFRIV